MFRQSAAIALVVLMFVSVAHAQDERSSGWSRIDFGFRVVLNQLNGVPAASSSVDFVEPGRLVSKDSLDLSHYFAITLDTLMPVGGSNAISFHGEVGFNRNKIVRNGWEEFGGSYEHHMSEFTENAGRAEFTIKFRLGGAAPGSSGV